MLMMMDCRQSTYSWIAEVLPRAKSPLAWTIVNLICLIWSLLLLFDYFLVTEHLEDRPGATAFYLTWNFATTAVWCVQVGLDYLLLFTSSSSAVIDDDNYDDDDDGDEDDSCYYNFKTRCCCCCCTRNQLDRWARISELVLAVFFLVDSGELLYQWRLTDNDLEEQLGEVLLYLFGYLFISSETAILYNEQKRRRHDSVDLEAGQEGAGTTIAEEGKTAATGLLASLNNQARATPKERNDEPFLQVPYGTA